MTQSFLTHKKLEKRYEKTAIPASELAKMREEEQAQCRMTSILKKMHSPNNFAPPTMMLPGESTLGKSMQTNMNQHQLSMYNSSQKKSSLSPLTTANSRQVRSKFIASTSRRQQEEEIY